jgi:hypothetical protein
MIEWVMIILMYNHNGSVAASSVTFNSQATCAQAMNGLQTQASYNRETDTVVYCAPK